MSEIDTDPRWYQRAVIYQTHVRAFYDSDRDGIGDFRGLTAKLDYIHDLGVTAIWLLPFYPSPLRDGGYDIADYCGINPDYGTMRDFRTFVRAAHERGIRVITELVLNHTSDQHRWFQRARTAKPGSKWRDFYVWSDTPDRYAGARIIFKDFESSNWAWDPLAKAYYWHRFYSHQPDLNWDNPAVERELYKVIDFWLEAGVDGLRLDAVPYLYEREGTSCENLPETHAALARLRRHVDQKFQGRMLLSEANQWPEDAVAYFGAGDESHMCFHFPLMPRLYMAMESEDRFPLIDIMLQTPEIPDGCQWAVFLRNHDELTLEMVTDEERDYMYRAYAQSPRARLNLGIRRRLAPLLGNDRRKIELLNGLLFSLNGTPIVYYGDEIGMGDNIYLGDRDGVRTPMQWNADRNAGFSEADPQQLYLPVNIAPEYRFEAVNVEAQQRNPSSLYRWMKRLVSLRRRYRVLGEGALELLSPDNPKILAFLRRGPGGDLLVVANLSRSVQYAELDLGAFKHRVPREVFGRTRFPPIGELPYLVTLGPYAFYWLDLQERDDVPELTEGEPAIPEIRSRASFAALTAGRSRPLLERVLPRVLASRRWFGGKARVVDSVQILDALEPPEPEHAAWRILLLSVDYVEGAPEEYLLPVAYLEGAEAWQRVHAQAVSALARVIRGAESDKDGLIVDALDLSEFRSRLLRAIADRKRWHGSRGSLRGRRTRATRDALEPLGGDVPSSLSGTEQSNTSVVYADSVMLKVLRRAQPGVNPDFEIGRFLTEAGELANVPAVVGALEYRGEGREPITVAVAHRYIQNQGDAYEYTLSQLGLFLENALSEGASADWAHAGGRHWPMLPRPGILADEDRQRLGDYGHLVELLGRRTAELHLALGRRTGDPAFDPEPFGAHYQRGLYQSMRSLVLRTLEFLRARLDTLPEALRDAAESTLAAERQLLARLHRVTARRLGGRRIRCHGDFHLGQVLLCGRDWVIIDFEGEPTRAITERRIKRSPLRDVAGMLRSFHYAANHAIGHEVARGTAQPGSDTHQLLRAAADYWSYQVGSAFLQSYLRQLEESPLLPEDDAERRLLLEVFMLEKAVYELAYELNHRPELVAIPLAAIARLLTDEEDHP